MIVLPVLRFSKFEKLRRYAVYPIELLKNTVIVKSYRSIKSKSGK